ncbi:PREDICTED: probable Histone-lysine N-methyltransferase ATXR5 isoform X1 [Nicotiana attenuata]|uniref:[histone H3]-lysine(27) N-methyltransferase n=1 Tax=Nicotiana attenuata TaxID=49451 RepID=A0A1J6KAC4_NICAT|nr:PREDICTED: probable Histone-lysine N-methyltransferase ATXR5 isoform X1 [Nicotiana attenuata]OIT27026.1 putative histone-lysine n-methyltransferase atxr5 [Nicotiana attenuata]
MAPPSSASPVALSRPVAQRKVRPAADSSESYRRRRRPRPRLSVSPPPKKFRSMEEIMRVAKRVELPPDDDSEDDGNDGEDVMCEQCGSGERPEELLLCDKCNKGFHMLCLRPIVVRVPIGPWHCPHCSGDQNRTIKSFSQKKIVDFFGIQKGSEVMVKCTSAQDSRKRRRRCSLVFHKRRRRILPFTPTEDPRRRLVQMTSLASALTALNMEFSDELTYMPDMAPRSANCAKFESGGMQVLSKEDTETLEQCRAMCKRGEWPPLMVVFDSREGYTVEADGPIKDLTIIAEYTGDVDYIRNRQEDDCDSMMTLLLASDPSRSLVICPDKRGNITRFINGINNHTPEGKKKQNLKCVRYNVNGECRVLLVAVRDIAKGERLYYDYNGYEHEYPTHHFV